MLSEQKKKKKEMIFLVWLAVGVSAALYRQAFDADVVTNGTRNSLLTDGAHVSGSAVVNGSELTSVLRTEEGGFHVPGLNGSSLGWSATIELRMIGGSRPADGVWLLWGNAFNITTNHVFSGLAGNDSFSFLVWMIDTFTNPNGTAAGFFIANRTAGRMATMVSETLLPNQEVNASIFVAWNQEHGATFRTSGFFADANMTDIAVEHNASDSHSWSIAARGNTMFVVIDNIVIDAPCGDCQAGGGECVWHAGGQFECRLPSALQFLRVVPMVGHSFSTLAFGIDFTVYAAIDVVAIGLLDADSRGINGTLVARIFDRSTDRVVVGPVTVKGGEARVDDANPFVFKAVPTTRLPPGVYCILSVGFSSDRYMSTVNAPGSVAASDSDAVLITASVSGGNGSLASTANITSAGRVCGATFRFAVVPAAPPPPLPVREFADCEAVACADLGTGEHNVRGELRFCDNDMAGGGWLRLWRANETRCEANGWSSSRNPRATGSDPGGCRPMAGACVDAQTTKSPFVFNEVRGGNWNIWAFGTPDGFNVAYLCDGVIVRDANKSTVWLLGVGLIEGPQPWLRCPCEAAFMHSPLTSANFNATGPHWTCDRAAARGTTWTRLFRGESAFICTANKSDDVRWFQRALSGPQSSLSIGICKTGDSGEDIKLVSGDLYVRATVGFDKTRCATTTQTSTTASAAIITVTRTAPATTSEAANSTTIAASTLMSVVTPSIVETVPESTDVALIAGIVGGAVVFLALIGVAVAVGMRRLGKGAARNDVPMVATTTTSSSASNYGVAPPAKYEPPVRTSEYGPISERGEFASMRADSHYAASVVDVKNVGRSNYSALTPAEGSRPT
jgi:hypothetical protein